MITMCMHKAAQVRAGTDDEDVEYNLSISNPALYWHTYVRPDVIDDIDPELIPVIDALNNAGQLTDECCAGHSMNEKGAIYFERRNPNNRIIRRILTEYGLKNIKRRSFFYEWKGEVSVYYEFDPVGVI